MKRMLPLLLILLILLGGCSSSKQAKDEPKKFQDGTMLAALAEYNLTLYSYISADRYLYFSIISSEPIDGKVKLSIDIDTPYSLELNQQDDNFKNVPLYSTPIHILADYEYEGTVYTTSVEDTYRVRHDFGELVALLNDHVDLMPYYTGQLDNLPFRI